MLSQTTLSDPNTSVSTEVTLIFLNSQEINYVKDIPDIKDNDSMWTYMSPQIYFYFRKHALISVVLAASVNRGSVSMGDSCLLFLFIFGVVQKGTVSIDFTSCHLVLLSTSGLSFLCQQLHNLLDSVIHFLLHH